MTLEEAVKDLSTELNWPNWLTSIGQGINCIYVYTKRKLTNKELALFENGWKGFTVNVTVTGEIRPTHPA